MSSYRLNRSNGLSKSSSHKDFLIPYELNDYNKVYLPLIKINQQAEILSNKIDKTNRIKDEILSSKYKLYNNRGIYNNYNYYRNKFKDSWDNFYKRKEREKRRKKIYKIIKDEPYISSEEEDDDEIFRKGMINKIEDKIKLKQYLPAKRDLAKLMFRVNDNINERIDKNSYLLSKNIINLENGYGELKDMIQNKINKLERKQEEDFYDLRLYFKLRAQREKDKFDNNKLILENGNDVYQVNNNIEDNYNYKANMKDNIEKLQTYEITKRIQNIPNLFDNIITNIEQIRKQRKKEKNDFLLNFNNQINDYYKNAYENIDDDLIGEKNKYNKYNKYNDYAYNLDNYNDSFMGYEDTFLTASSQNYFNNKYRYSKSKPRTEYRRNNKKDMLSMSKSDILSLKNNLIPLSYQNPKKNKMNLNDDDDSLTANDLKEIYKQKNATKNILERKKNEINSNKEISIKENKTINKSKESKEKKETNKKEDSDDDVVVVESDADKTKSQKKETKNEEKEKSEENNNNIEKKEEINNNIEKKEEINNNIEKKEEVNNNIEKKEEVNNNIEKKEDNSEEGKEEKEKSEEGGNKEGNDDDENNDENENDDENNEENENDNEN